MILGEKIRELRLERQLLQRELAEKLHIAQNTLSQFEKGKANPSYEVLMQLADFFECSIDYLLGRSDDFGVISIHSQKTKSAPILNQNGNELIEIFNALEDSYQAQILEYARYIAERRGIKPQKNKFEGA